jgi:SIR2-like protein
MLNVNVHLAARPHSKEFELVRSRTRAAGTRAKTDLFEHMLIGCQDSPDNFVKGNDVVFVTFNYDRTLEYFLAVRLENTYGLSSDDAANFVGRMRIIHVYGSLGPYETSLLHRGPGAQDARVVAAAASTIRLMYEDRAEQSAIGEAREAVSSAKTICFLGFGFDADNIARLELNTRCQGKTVGGTRYKVADGDWSRSVQRMAPSGFNYPADRAWDCLAYLRETTFRSVYDF